MGEAKFSSELVKTATTLARYCNEGKTRDGLRELYDPACVSAEALPGPNGKEAHGLDAIGGKHDWWESAMTEHSTSADGPFLHAPDKFSLIFHMDVTDNESGNRMQMSEVGLYTVNAAGKIVREEFFFNPQDMPQD